MNDTVAEDVASYAGAVRAAFQDLPAADSEELLEDLESHLEEVLAETGGPLSESLGPPAAYAEELRASAGLPPPGGVTSRRRRSPAQWFQESWSGRLLRATAAHPAGRAVLDFLPQLQPAWWVLRGYLAVQLLSAVLPSQSGTSFPVPSLFGSTLLGLLVTAGAVVGSVAIARRGATTRRARRLRLLANTGLAVFALIFLGGLAAGTSVTVTPTPAVAQGKFFVPGLRQNGVEISNIFPFDAQGRPLHDVYLVDQDGNPIIPSRYDHDLEALLPRDAQGNPIANRFPQQQLTVDPSTGVRRPAPTPGFQPPPTTAPVPSTTAPATTTAPTTTTGTAPTTTRR